MDKRVKHIRMEVKWKLTTFSKCCPDFDGGEVLEERLKLEGGQLRLPPAARLLIQSE